MIEDQYPRVYTVESVEGNRLHNYSTGTRIYTKRHNAERLAKRRGWRQDDIVKEYVLVPIEVWQTLQNADVKI